MFILNWVDGDKCSRNGINHAEKGAGKGEITLSLVVFMAEVAFRIGLEQ